MITAILAGAGLGAAVCFLIWTLIPSPVDHVAVLGRIDAARAARPAPVEATAPPAGDRLARVRSRAGTRVNALLTRHGIRAGTLRQDLALTDRRIDDFLGGTVLAATLTLVGALFAATLLLTEGAPLPPVAVLPVAVLAACLLAWARLHDVHKLAEQRRREFRRGLSAYLDLVAMSVVAGTGLPEALPAAAAVGQGWPFRLLADTLTTARDASGPLAVASELGRLGERVGVGELRDLSIALSLTGEQGARIATTLIERAKTLRARDTADVQGRADERGASMDLPRVGIGFGFLLFVVYPLVVSVLHY
jgi:Flp pilus assembly protein TadB